MGNFLFGSGILFALVLLTACGDSVTGPTASSGNTTKLDASQPSPTGISTAANGIKTAKPFFTPVQATPSAGNLSYVLAFDDTPGNPALEASMTSLSAPDQVKDEWQLQILTDGNARYTRNPRDPARQSVENRYINPEKMTGLLQQLDKLGVLAWPDTTPPTGTPLLSRNLALYLKGRAKQISDLSGGSGDNLAKMLDLIKQTVEDAPLKNAP